MDIDRQADKQTDSHNDRHRQTARWIDVDIDTKYIIYISRVMCFVVTDMERV